VSKFGSVPFCEGEFWRYVTTHWEAIPQFEMRRVVHRYDGAPFGDRGTVKLGKARVDSILSELGAMLSDEQFFADAPVGINCANGFISFDTEGSPKLASHDRDHRQRHVLPGAWQAGQFTGVPEKSLLGRLLRGSFEGDPDAAEKMELLAEIAGAAALGHATQLIKPKAVVLLGRTAENGKSQVLDVLRGLLPPTAVASVPPSKFGDERFVVKLAGKLLNTSDELGNARAIASDAFKAIVTGDPVPARDLYKSAVNFRPEAQHVFACNQLPPFQGGMDRGVSRRMLVIVFNRTIPEKERVVHIGQRIVTEEPDLLLGWAVEGARRLIKRGYFPELPSSQAALTEWAETADPVLGWIEDRLVVVPGPDAPRLATRKAFDDFRAWAIEEGYPYNKLPAINTFSQRVEAALKPRGVVHKHGGDFRGFEGVQLRSNKPGERTSSVE
jgi:putative DNA primase/helicase